MSSLRRLASCTRVLLRQSPARTPGLSAGLSPVLHGLRAPNRPQVLLAIAGQERAYKGYAQPKPIDDSTEGVVAGMIVQRNSGKYTIRLDGGHELTATRAGRMRSLSRKLRPGQRVYLQFDLDTDFDEQTPKIVSLAAEADSEEEAEE